MRIYDMNKTYELVKDEPNIFTREIIWIDGKEYRLIDSDWELGYRNIGTYSWDFETITYVEDTSTGQLYITLQPDKGVLLPIQNTDPIVGFRFNYHRRDNELAYRRSLLRASMERVYILPYYKVGVKFRGHYWYYFVSNWLSFPLVYCCCKYFFDALYPDGYDSYDISYPVNFRAGASALNNIKEWFGKKSTRQIVDAKYCLRNYANKRDWRWSREYHMKRYGYSPLDELF